MSNDDSKDAEVDDLADESKESMMRAADYLMKIKMLEQFEHEILGETTGPEDSEEIGPSRQDIP